MTDKNFDEEKNNENVNNNIKKSSAGGVFPNGERTNDNDLKEQEKAFNASVVQDQNDNLEYTSSLPLKTMGENPEVEVQPPMTEYPTAAEEPVAAHEDTVHPQTPPAPPAHYPPQSFNNNQYMQTPSGEYKYIPPHNTNGFAPPPPPPYNPPEKKEKKKVKGRSFSTGAVALIIASCLVVSLGAGFGGAYIANNVFGVSTGGANDSLVIYKTAAIADADGNKIEGTLTETQVAAIVKDSVVEITTEVLTSYGPYQYVSEGAGSGVIINDNGYIITNNHVISDESGNAADTVKVRLTDGTEYTATVVGKDSDSDIAVLKIEAENLTYAVIGDSDALSVGDKVLAVGNPLGELGGTVTSGMISATGREINVDGTDMKLLQTDTAVNPGNSGGGLFNMRGELIGIVNAKSSGSGIEGLAFAIPSKDAVRVAEEIKTNGYVTGKTYVGLYFVDATDPLVAYRYFGTQATGVYVYETVKGYNDGVLQKGDRVIAVDGKEITSSDDIKTIVKAKSVGDVLKFSVYRGGTLTEVNVTCYEYVPQTDVSFETAK